MSRQSSPAAGVVVPLLIGVGIGGLALLRWAPARWQAALPVYGEVPTFALVDQQGQPVSGEALRGSVWVADFIFTRCAGQCPMMSAQMAQLAARLPHDSGVRLVSFTVDPTWDTPEVLARYAAPYRGSAAAPPGCGTPAAARIVPPRSAATWSFLTGDEAAIRRLCREGFHVALSEQGTDAEPITHSTRLVLVDRQGQIRGSYEATDEAAMRQLRRDLRRVL